VAIVNKTSGEGVEFSFVLPKGEQGEQGIQGIQVKPGDDGIQGTTNASSPTKVYITVGYQTGNNQSGPLPKCSKFPLQPQCHFLKTVQDYTSVSDLSTASSDHGQRLTSIEGANHAKAWSWMGIAKS